MKLIFLIIVSWFSPLIVVGENTYNGGRVIANTNKGEKGDDAKYKNPTFRRERNFLFTTSVKEVSAKLIYDIYKPYKGDEALLFPYIGAGLGLNFFNIKKDYSRLTTKLSSAEPNILTGLAADDSKKLPRLLVTMPVVVGVRKMLTERIDFFTELNYRFVYTDYLDGFSQAANPKEKDKFL